MGLILAIAPLIVEIVGAFQLVSLSAIGQPLAAEMLKS
jgi:hypothetical protein